MATSDPLDPVEHLSAFPFAQTLEKVVAAIEAGGLTVFAQIDHAAGARTVGLNMPPSTVVIYGNPKGGTPLMLAVPNAALDLPLRVLVREEADGHAVIAFHPVVALLGRDGLSEALAAKLEPAQALLVKAIQP